MQLKQQLDPGTNLCTSERITGSVLPRYCGLTARVQAKILVGLSTRVPVASMR